MERSQLKILVTILGVPSHVPSLGVHYLLHQHEFLNTVKREYMHCFVCYSIVLLCVYNI